MQLDGSVEFERRDIEAFRNIKLVVVDEASMPNAEIINDLMALDIPVLFVGDHGQLQPIGEKSWVYERLKFSPDFALTKIRRQAEGNPVIWLSKLAREGKPIPFGMFEKKVAVIEKQNLQKYNKSLVNADIVICGMNATRHALNQKIRRLRGINTTMPVNGDKIICVQNDWHKVCGNYPLVNGMIGFISNLRDDYDDTFCRFTFTPDFTDESVEVRALKAQLLGEKVETKLLRDKNDPIDQFNYGQAITCHKSQGSQWGNVLIVNETFKNCEPNEHGYNPEWLYTGVTRAENASILAIKKQVRYYQGFRAA